MRAPRVQRILSVHWPSTTPRVCPPPRHSASHPSSARAVHDPQRCELISGSALPKLRSNPSVRDLALTRHKQLAFNVSKGRANPYLSAVDSVTNSGECFCTTCLARARSCSQRMHERSSRSHTRLAISSKRHAGLESTAVCLPPRG